MTKKGRWKIPNPEYHGDLTTVIAFFCNFEPYFKKNQDSISKRIRIPGF